MGSAECCPSRIFLKKRFENIILQGNNPIRFFGTYLNKAYLNLILFFHK